MLELAYYLLGTRLHQLNQISKENISIPFTEAVGIIYHLWVTINKKN